MSTIQISIKLLETFPIIKRKILLAIRNELNRIIPAITPNILNEIRRLTPPFFQATETYKSLVSGELAGHFGFPYGSGQEIVDSIIERIVYSIQIEINKVLLVGSSYLTGGLTVKILLADFTDVLGLDVSYTVTEKAEVLPWLDWLLTFGDEIIIEDYGIAFKPGYGRSGKAKMLSDDDARALNIDAYWRVPLEYSGTIDDNWLTRVILSQGYKQMVSDVITTKFRKTFS